MIKPQRTQGGRLLFVGGWLGCSVTGMEHTHGLPGWPVWSLILCVRLTRPRCLVKYYSECCGLWMMLTFKWVDTEQSRWASTMCVGPIQSAEDLRRAKTDLPWARRDSASRWPLAWTATPPLGLQLAILDLPGLHNHVSWFLQVNVSLYMYTHPTGSISQENLD